MAIIDDILDYSKIESGKLSLEKRILDLVRYPSRTVLRANVFLDICHRKRSEVNST
jgi:signal transduction histidine kinase